VDLGPATDPDPVADVGPGPDADLAAERHAPAEEGVGRDIAEGPLAGKQDLERPGHGERGLPDADRVHPGGKLDAIPEALAAHRLTLANGGGELVSITIDPELLKQEDLSMVQDLIVAATNAALTKSSEMVEAEVEKVTGGMKIPGLA